MKNMVSKYIDPKIIIYVATYGKLSVGGFALPAPCKSTKKAQALLAAAHRALCDWAAMVSKSASQRDKTVIFCDR